MEDRTAADIQDFEQEFRKIALAPKDDIVARYALQKKIAERFGLAHKGLQESLLLYGIRWDHLRLEALVGRLLAYAPGLVIFSPEGDHLKPFAGFLRRTRFVTAPFKVEPFKEFPHGDLKICLCNTEKPRYETCPAYIDWQIGAGHGESYSQEGIEPSRWEYLKKWLDKWLPPETVPTDSAT